MLVAPLNISAIEGFVFPVFTTISYEIVPSVILFCALALKAHKRPDTITNDRIIFFIGLKVLKRRANIPK
jgi:hypothetical protein